MHGDGIGRSSDSGRDRGRQVFGKDAISSEFSMNRSFLTKEQKLGMYRKMLLCRLFEDRVNSLFLQGRMPGTIHQAQGQEACAVGVCQVLLESDMLTSTHRPHEHAVARGIPVKSLMAELFAKSTG